MEKLLRFLHHYMAQELQYFDSDSEFDSINQNQPFTNDLNEYNIVIPTFLPY